MPAVSELTALIDVPAGCGQLGSEDFYPEEKPVRRVHIPAFRLEAHPVTNAQFADFTAATGYLTTAELPLPPDLALGPGRTPGSLVFTPTPGPVPLDDWQRWWTWVQGADWRHPHGPDDDLVGKDSHPVVHISRADALAYAAWAGRRLPSEDEWEYAARGPGAATVYAWGDEPRPGGRIMANTWQGEFPHHNTGRWRTTSPVGSYPPNGLGLLDMIGNVWEWTASPFDRAGTSPGAVPGGSCCAPAPAALGPDRHTFAVKGGSHLCAPEYCHRYRPAARQPQTEDSASTHLGFRCAV